MCTPSRTRRRPHRRTERGFTIIEVMIAGVVLAVGLLAMMAMQIAFIQGTSAANDVSVGTFVAEKTAQRIEGEAVNWNSYSPNLGGSNTPMLNALTSNGNLGQWTLLYGGYPVTHEAIPTAPAMAVDNPASRELNARFCVDGRADWQVPGRVLVGQIRVTWATNQDAPWLTTPPSPCAESRMTDVVYPAGVANTNVNVTYIPFALRRQSL